MATTIKDIARESGYAVSTVSRVLNNHPDVSAEAKARILQVVAERDFVINSNAHQLKSQITRSVLIVVKGTFNPFFATIIEKMQARIGEAGFTADVRYLEEDANEVLAARQLSAEIKPKGIAFLGGSADTFRQSFGEISLPSVLVTTVVEDLTFPNLSCIGVDDRQSFMMLVQHMAAKGHRKFAILGGNPDTSYISNQRYEGAKEAFAALGIDFPEERYEKAAFTLGSGYRAVKRLCGRTRDFTCLMCMSDVMALGAMRGLHEMGIRVPEDVSVTGFDGIEQSLYAVPSLTTMGQPQSEIALEAVERLLLMIAGKSFEERNVVLPPEMQLRESSGEG